MAAQPGQARQALSALVTLIGFVAIWWLFAPPALGGVARFVIINGNSMAPLYQRGDLVITRAADDYGIGDIVTYRHPEIGLVIHRIIARNGDRWQLKGDHNDFVDPYQPLTAEIEGRAWLHLPRAGAALTGLRQYWPLLALGVAGGVIMVAQSRTPRQRPRSPLSPSFQWLDLWLSALTLSGLGALIGAALAVYSWIQPVSQAVIEPLTYNHEGQFTYLADAPAGLYDTAHAQTGDPIYLQLSSALEINFHYHLRNATIAQAMADLAVDVSAANGWRRRLALTPAQSFQDSPVVLTARISLAELRALISQLEQQTGLSSQYYVVTVQPRINLTGQIEETSFNDTFAPQLLFRLDRSQLVLMSSSGPLEGLTPRAEGRIERPLVKPARLALLFVSFDAQAVRLWSLAGLGGFLLLTVALGWPLWQRWQRDEATRIHLAYGNLLVDGTMPRLDRPVISVATMADLARLAQRTGSLIMRDLTHIPMRYALVASDAIYAYMPDRAAAALPDAQPDRSARELSPSAAVAAIVPPADWQARFLAVLRQGGLVSEACQAAQVDPLTAYRERAANPEFAQAWRVARQTGCAQIAGQ